MALDPTITIWPAQLAPRAVARKRLHPVNLSPEPIATAPQSVSSDAGRLGVSLRQIPIHGDKLLTFRATIAYLTSPLRPVYVPIAERLRTPRARAALALPAGVPFSDGSTFSDTTLFADQPIDFKVMYPAAARAMQITVRRQGPVQISLAAGNYIGLGGRAYLITKIFDAADGYPGHYDLSLWPILREAAAAGDPVYSEFPVVKCIIAPDNAEVAEELDFDRYGFVDLDFVEYRW